MNPRMLYSGDKKPALPKESRFFSVIQIGYSVLDKLFYSNTVSAAAVADCEPVEQSRSIIERASQAAAEKSSQ